MNLKKQAQFFKIKARQEIYIPFLKIVTKSETTAFRAAMEQ